ncbi:MAG: SDR family NAD(P)-dependent oxidoreductase [Terriglobales bacterium]|jgi:3-oxoacyl-[acyl-carrier protein] reductase
MSVSLTLQNKVALISGGSRGIGAACVRMFVQAGAKVVFNYRKDRRAADELVRALGPEVCYSVQADLSSAESAEPFIAAAVERFGRVDALVGNHGIWPVADVGIDTMSDEQWRRTMAINLDSVFGLVKHSAAQMKKQKSGGSIVLVSSTSGQRGEAFHADYSATKGAVISLVKSLSTELATDNIRVNSVAPGWVHTDMTAGVLNDPKTRGPIVSKIPMGRAGTPEEIAGPILFLCSDYAGFINGEIFNVNGGAVLVG